MAEFRKESHQGGGRDGTNAGELKQTSGLGVKVGVLFNVRSDERLDLCDTFFEQGEALIKIAKEDFIGGHFTVLFFAPGEFAELVAARDQCGQAFLARSRLRGRGRLELGADAGKRGCIHGIGLGKKTETIGEFAGAGGMKYADGDAGGTQGSDDLAFVTAGGLADDLDWCAVGQDTRTKRGMAGGIIGEGKGCAAQVASKAGFGDVKAEVDE